MMVRVYGWKELWDVGSGFVGRLGKVGVRIGGGMIKLVVMRGGLWGCN